MASVSVLRAIDSLNRELELHILESSFHREDNTNISSVHADAFCKEEWSAYSSTMNVSRRLYFLNDDYSIAYVLRDFRKWKYKILDEYIPTE